MRHKVLAELEVARAEGGGLLMPRRVVDRARDPDNPLHGQFEWDDSEAAENYRLYQARKLIRAAVLILPAGNQGPQEVRAYVSLSTDRPAGGGYWAVTDVLDNQQALEVARRDLVRSIMGLRRKFGVYAALRPVLDDLEEVVRADLPQAA